MSAKQAIEAEVRLYDRLFSHPTPDATKDGSDYKMHLNPDSLRSLTQCYLEANLGSAQPGEWFQFEREGYFCTDPARTANGMPIFNRTVTLRDSWAKIEKQQNSGK